MPLLQIQPLPDYLREQYTDLQIDDLPEYRELTGVKKAGLGLFGIGSLLLLIALTGFTHEHPWLWFFLTFGLTSIGGLMYILAQLKESPPGIKNHHNFTRSLTARGAAGWLIGVVFTAFYIILYWFPSVFQNWIAMVDPLSRLLRGDRADHWFLYGTFYTFAVLIMGVRMFVRYRHNRYQLIRTGSVMFFQLGFAYLIPAFLRLMNQPEFYFSYFWPLKYEYLFPGNVQTLLSHPGGLGVFMVFWGAMLTFVATPVLTYFYGKRWYCSWVCGCGGLAETLGDPWRHLSSKTRLSWKVERNLIYSVLGFIIITTAMLWINSATEGRIFGQLSNTFARAYGFFIGAIFSGVIGVGFYPLLGNRVWCRFGCPQAAILGLLQKHFSRFRITTNGAQCISCGNCSTYCEMGIDVRMYAQEGKNIIRASCVGCGICAAVCPRGVLKLENGPLEGRYN